MRNTNITVLAVAVMAGFIGGVLRTKSVTAPDSSTTLYEYAANTVKVTDPTGKSKTFTMDALGNLVLVQEPDPAAPTTSTYSTYYTYDVLEHLINVSMPRGSYTQTRSFDYGSPPGAYLMSATNPETGTVKYSYNPGGTLASKNDINNQPRRAG